MTRREILKGLLALGLTESQGKKALDAFFGTLTRALERGESVSINGFGAWEWKVTRPRKARNPRTGQAVQLGSRKVLAFKPSRRLRERLNQLKKS
ncbi:MAG TPA: HU family DNA-binding protein [bacterium]|nr:HU family DNA-binding protein [bacterium]